MRHFGFVSRDLYQQNLREISNENCSPSPARIVKGDRFSLDECPRNNLELEKMRDTPYASIVVSLMYTQVCKEGNALPSGYKALHVDVQIDWLLGGNWLLWR